MLSLSSPYQRFVFCLLVSGVLHGGIAALNWQKQPAHKLSAVDVHEIVLKKIFITDHDEVENQPQEHLTASKQLVKKQANVKPHQQASTGQKVSVEKKALAKVQRATQSDLLLDDLVVNTLQTQINRPDNNSLSHHIIEPQAILNSSEHKGVSATNRQKEPLVKDFSSRVDVQPRYQDNPLPEYPLLARRRHLEGVVWLRVQIAPNGTVRKISLEKTSGHGLLDRSAQNAVQSWTFIPAMRAGVPVESQVKVPVHFQLHKG
ncbi:MAG: energy transducer TonB [Deltaproteobacteria bacterium]|jgi:TonB family protein|nr:energy transducer TonB [Deltaproteobacteria bacterium]